MLQGQRYPICVLLVSDQISPFFFMASPFRITDYLETIAPNDLQHYKVKGTHALPTNVPESQISPHFTLQPTFSRYKFR